MSSTAISSQKFLAELTENNDFFDMVVNMIPSKLYIAGKSGDDYNPKNRYYKTSKEDRKVEMKLKKRRKLDPTKTESTVDQQKEGIHATTTSMKTATPSAEADSNLLPHQSRIELLRAKLHAKIAEKQSQRPAQKPDQVSKRAARRAEKERRQKEAAQRKKAAKSKVLQTAAEHYQMTTAAQDLEQLDFGRLTGLNSKTSENYAATNKSLANLSKSKNLKKMLADAEEKRKKLQALKQGSEEDKAKATAMQWSDTLKEADGQRIKDDPAKLKKALKRKAAKKAKSQKAWKARMEQTASSKEERQKIRQHNLSARKQGGAVGANLSKKKIATEDDKKGDGGRRLSRAGFEGRKREFLTSPPNKTSQ